MPRLGGNYAHNRMEAELEDLARVLASYGVLTGERLRELSGASHWTGPRFESVLAHGVREGRIRRLGDELYELSDPPLRNYAGA